MNNISEQFFAEYLKNGFGQKTSWCGIKTQKFPFDAWVYQELIWEKKPTKIIELGSASGGSAYFLGMILNEIGNGGTIITVEKKENNIQRRHSLVEYLTGSSTDPEIIQIIKERIQPDDRVMIILDSDHDMEHVYNELVAYHSIVSQGHYLIVEDTFWVDDKTNVGPRQAVHKFLKDYPDLFDIDKSQEKFLITYNPDGFLLRR